MQADHKKVQHLLNVASGQLAGISKMVEEDAYCIEISNQVLAAIAVLKRANKAILTAHLNHCVRDAYQEGDIDVKLKEIETVLNRLD